MKSLGFISWLVASFCLYVQCHRHSTPAASRPALQTKESTAPLPYGLWILQDVQGSDIGVNDGTYITISDSAYYLYAGCNHIDGSLRIKPDSIFFDSGYMTLMACKNEKGYERKFSTLLFSVTTYQSTTNILILKAADGAMLRFKKQTPAEHLIGKKFLVWGLNMNGSVRYSANAPKQHIYFHPDGTLSGNAGCNTYNATYKIEGNLLYINPISSTKKTCSTTAMEYETFFLRLLQPSPITIHDSPDSIRLSRDDNTLMVLSED